MRQEQGIRHTGMTRLGQWAIDAERIRPLAATGHEYFEAQCGPLDEAPC